MDKGHILGALLTHFSKTFGCLPQKLWIAKLNANGFDNRAVKFVYDCITCRKKRTKISDIYRSGQKFYRVVPKVQYLDHYYSKLTYAICLSFLRARSFVVSDLRLETKGSRFESGCYLCAEVRSPLQSPG